MSNISRIRILDLDQNSNGDNSSEDNSNSSSSSAHITRSRTRPLTVPKDDPQLIIDGLDLTERFGIKVYNVQDYVEEQDGDDDSGDDIENCEID
ncbi:hypothetical protein BGZ98_005299, partial [Dissophora globulifera]